MSTHMYNGTMVDDETGAYAPGWGPNNPVVGADGKASLPIDPATGQYILGTGQPGVNPWAAYGNFSGTYNPTSNQWLADPATWQQQYAANNEQMKAAMPKGDFMSTWGPAIVGALGFGAIAGAGAGAAGAGAAEGGASSLGGGLAADAGASSGIFNAAGTGALGGAGYAGEGLTSISDFANGGGGGGEDPSAIQSGSNNMANDWYGTDEAGGVTGEEAPVGGSSLGAGEGIGGNTNLLQNLARAFGMTTADGSVSPSALLSLSNLLGGGIGALAARSAANTQANASNNATAATLGMFNTINQQQAPWRQAGANALGTIGQMQPYFNHQFDANDLKTNLAPNYDFMLKQGLGATSNAMNLQTGWSGNTLKGINDYAQNYAGNAYQNAFNNYTANQSNIFNRLASIAGLGQQANTSTAQAGTSAAQTAAGSMQNAGAAQAAGTVGMSNALSGGINNAASWYALPQILNGGVA